MAPNSGQKLRGTLPPPPPPPRHRRVAPSCRSISVMTRRFGVSAADCSERGGGPSQSAEVGCRGRGGGGGRIYTAAAKTNRAPQNTNTAVCPPSPSPTGGRSHRVRRDGRTDGRTGCQTGDTSHSSVAPPAGLDLCLCRCSTQKP